jgi:hypothetical protein
MGLTAFRADNDHANLSTSAQNDDFLPRCCRAPKLPLQVMQTLVNYL